MSLPFHYLYSKHVAGDLLGRERHVFGTMVVHLRDDSRKRVTSHFTRFWETSGTKVTETKRKGLNLDVKTFDKNGFLKKETS